MNEDQLQDKLPQILLWVEETAKSAEAFAVEQTPIYIQELLAWNFWISLIWFILGVVLFISGVFPARTFLKEAKKEDYDEYALMISSFSAASGLLFGCILISCNLNWLQILVAPRVWLVEYIQKFI